MRSAMCPHTSFSSAYLWWPFQVSVVHSLQNNTASLPPPPHEKAAAYFRRYIYRCYSLLRSVQASSACVCRTEALLTLYTFSQSRRVQKLTHFLATTVACVFACFSRTRMAISTHFCSCAKRVNQITNSLVSYFRHNTKTYRETITQFVSIQIDGQRLGILLCVHALPRYLPLPGG